MFWSKRIQVEEALNRLAAHEGPLYSEQRRLYVGPLSEQRKLYVGPLVTRLLTFKLIRRGDLRAAGGWALAACSGDETGTRTALARHDGGGSPDATDSVTATGRALLSGVLDAASVAV